MALSNKDRIGKALELVTEGLYDIVDQVMTNTFGTTEWPEAWAKRDADRKGSPVGFIPSKDDIQTHLRAITENGYDFKEVFSRTEQGFAQELRDARNAWAHTSPISSEDALRWLDTAERLLRAANATDSAGDVRKLRTDLQSSVVREETRARTRTPQLTLEPEAGLKPWREVITPHDDVARGEFTASEFAADLHLVHTGQSVGHEYADPVEFFERTYLTDGLRELLTKATKRLTGDMGESPVVNLQTNFGGGKTHSLLALYHLFGGTPTGRFPQELQELLRDAGDPDLVKLGVRRAALVGTYLQPGSPSVKEDGTEVNTLWGELAWQLGGREAYGIVADADRTATNPGESLQTLLQQFSPCLILIDEWVAYARQLVTDKELPAGSFDTQFTFAQSLTEVVNAVPGAMLIFSIPASDGAGDGEASEIEVGGEHGKRALKNLQNVTRRLADQWRSSSRDESFEIVRRRLFQQPDAEAERTINVAARRFANMYRENKELFPQAASSAGSEYEDRIRSSYPLHPELLDRLYEDWATLERFQRTRGALKLVSSVVHELWKANDASPLIMPGTLPLNAPSVSNDLTQYLEDSWKPIIDAEVDGPDGTAGRIDLARPNLGSRHTTRRLARTIFFGAAPRNQSGRKGIDKQYVWLGTATPGDALGNFGSAIEQLGRSSAYFNEDQGHYWFDTHPTVTRTAGDYAERLREDPETVYGEIVRRLLAGQQVRGAFRGVHVAPETSADIPDVDETRLVLVHPRHARSKADGAGSATHQWVRKALETKGSAQRTHRNALVFLAADASELDNLEGATRSYLGWKQVSDAADSLNLPAQQKSLAETRVKDFDLAVESRIQDAFQWAMYPVQRDPAAPFEVGVDKVPNSGGATLGERVSTKLEREEQLITNFGAASLGATLQRELRPLWDDRGEVSIGELWQYFTRYPYMPRLVSRDVLDGAVQQAVETAVLLEDERFAIASDKDEATARYRALIVPPTPGARLQVTDSTLLVEYTRAAEQQIADKAEAAAAAEGSGLTSAPIPGGGRPDVMFETFSVTTVDAQEPPTKAGPTEFVGEIEIPITRYTRDFGSVSSEVIDRLVASGADVRLTLSIRASKEGGFDESEVRTISENARTLKFDPASGFVR